MNWFQIQSDIMAHANDAQPQECCGIVLRTGEVVRCENVFEPVELRNCRYTIDPLVLRRYNRDDVLGFYHSHPNSGAWPEENDVADARGLGMLELIVGMRNGTAFETRVFQVIHDSRTNGRRFMAAQPEIE